MNIRFFKPYITGKESIYMEDIIKNRLDMAGDGKYTKKAQAFLENRYGVKKALLTTSGTTALELSVRLLNLAEGDEIIVPSFTFSSTVNAILLNQGIKVVFADVEPDTLNIDPKDIEKRITSRTKALLIVHYAGVPCEMDKIMKIAKKHNLRVIEDAAQGIESTYKGKYLGTFGDFGCLSFHDTKNITCGEGGAILINTPNKEIIERAEIIREKGTNRSKFFRGQIDKYTWVDIGSSMLPSDLLAAYLFAQLEEVEKIIKLRMKTYEFYKEKLRKHALSGRISLPVIQKYVTHNAHIFFVLFHTMEERDFVLDYMRKNGVSASFHYIPLHSAPQGVKIGYKAEDVPVTESAAYRLIRLPIYSDMRPAERKKVIKTFNMALEAFDNSKPTVSVGISALNEGKNIHSLVKQILAQKQDSWRLKEVLIYSDGSTDNTVKEAKKTHSPFVHVIESKERKGKSFRINQICQKFSADFLVLFDGDIRLADTNVVNEVVNTFSKEENVGVVGGNTRPVMPKTFFESAIYSTFRVFDESRKKIKNGNNIFGCTGACIGIKKELAKKISFPDVLNEDDFIYFTCLSLGYTFLHAGKAVVYYKLPRTLQDYLKQVYRSNPEAVTLNLEKYFGELVAKEYKRPYSFYALAVLKAIARNPFATLAVISINFFCKPFYTLISKNYKLHWFTAVSTK